MKAGESRVNALVTDLTTGGSTEEFEREFGVLLTVLHTQAAYHGRHHAGYADAPDAADRQFANSVMGGEAPYLSQFISDIETGELSGPAIRQRALLYLSRVVGTANERFALQSPGLLYWRLGPEPSGHCQECPKIAAGSPYTRETLPTVPRANRTTCKFNCKCFLQRADGLTSFKP